MTSIQIMRLCSGLAIGGLFSLLGADALIHGRRLDLEVFRDGLAVLLIGWLFTGAQLARWIMCVSSGITTLVGMRGVLLFLLTHWRQIDRLTILQVTSFTLCIIGLAAFAVVAWRLATLPEDGVGFRQGGGKMASRSGSRRS